MTYGRNRPNSDITGRLVDTRRSKATRAGKRHASRESEVSRSDIPVYIEAEPR
jgi:hypothetical protein